MSRDTQTLIRNAAAGDRAALATLLEIVRPMVRAKARESLGVDDAEDVTQEALIHLVERLPGLDPAQPLGTYVRQLVAWRTIDFRRRRATRTFGDAEAEGETRRYESFDRLAWAEVLEAVAEPERSMFLMDVLDGHRHDALAAHFGVTVATLRKRLTATKRKLRAVWMPHLPKSPTTMTPQHQTLLQRTFGDFRVLEETPNPEPWMPFSYRLKLVAEDGRIHDVDLRDGFSADEARIIETLRAAGLPTMRILGRDGDLAATAVPIGENLTQWTMDGTAHRFRFATSLALDTIERLQAATPLLPELHCESLADVRVQLSETKSEWRDHALFAATMTLEAEERPLVFTDPTHYFPNFLRVKEQRLTEIVTVRGRIGDPLLDLAMVWIYDTYPFVHTGFVEQYLVRHDVPRQAFGIRLALQALRTAVRELPAQRPEDGAYWDALTGHTEQGLAWAQGT